MKSDPPSTKRFEAHPQLLERDRRREQQNQETAHEAHLKDTLDTGGETESHSVVRAAEQRGNQQSAQQQHTQKLQSLG